MTLENLANKLTKSLKSGYVIIDHRNCPIDSNSIVSIEDNHIVITNNGDSFENGRPLKHGFYENDLKKFKICKKFVNLN